MLWYTPYDPSAVEDEMNSWTVAMTLHCQAMQERREEKEGRERREREVTPRQWALSAVSWRHGDTETCGETWETRAVHARFCHRPWGFGKLFRVSFRGPLDR